ncbi:hypothetical protein DNTS_010196 [Danionella cerebrum]|uniref:Uncharacterized protein n=1 Tax=Danionella cerebrum TaxID=2873325 RepID=A0A553QD78_9TELE|nr:hypothetical protein DNTS_010196 [Danionella translucida]
MCRKPVNSVFSKQSEKRSDEQKHNKLKSAAGSIRGEIVHEKESSVLTLHLDLCKEEEESRDDGFFLLHHFKKIALRDKGLCVSEPGECPSRTPEEETDLANPGKASSVLSPVVCTLVFMCCEVLFKFRRCILSGIGANRLKFCQKGDVLRLGSYSYPSA